MSSRMSPRASHRRHQYAILASSPGSFYRRLFSYIGPYKYKTAFTTGKCRLKVKKENEEIIKKRGKLDDEIWYMISQM